MVFWYYSSIISPNHEIVDHSIEGLAIRKMISNLFGQKRVINLAPGSETYLVFLDLSSKGYAAVTVSAIKSKSI
jgi:hypothetical protein